MFHPFWKLWTNHIHYPESSAGCPCAHHRKLLNFKHTNKCVHLFTILYSLISQVSDIILIMFFSFKYFKMLLSLLKVCNRSSTETLDKHHKGENVLGFVPPHPPLPSPHWSVLGSWTPRRKCEVSISIQYYIPYILVPSGWCHICHDAAVAIL